MSAGCTIACVSVYWHRHETHVCDGCALRVRAGCIHVLVSVQVQVLRACSVWHTRVCRV